MSEQQRHAEEDAPDEDAGPVAGPPIEGGLDSRGKDDNPEQPG